MPHMTWTWRQFFLEFWRPKIKKIHKLHAFMWKLLKNHDFWCPTCIFEIKQELCLNAFDSPWTDSKSYFCLKVTSKIMFYHKNTKSRSTWNSSLGNIFTILVNDFFDLSCNLQISVTFLKLNSLCLLNSSPAPFVKRSALLQKGLT